MSNLARVFDILPSAQPISLKHVLAICPSSAETLSLDAVLETVNRSSPLKETEVPPSTGLSASEKLRALLGLDEQPADHLTEDDELEDYNDTIFVPYEVTLSDLVVLARRSLRETKTLAAKSGLIVRWSGDNISDIYLIRNDYEEELFQIEGGRKYSHSFNGYVDHNFPEEQSIMFKDRQYPYTLSSKDLDDLARRMRVKRNLVVRRVHDVNRRNIVEDQILLARSMGLDDATIVGMVEETRSERPDEEEEIMVPDRTAEMRILYTKATTEPINKKQSEEHKLKPRGTTLTRRQQALEVRFHLPSGL